MLLSTTLIEWVGGMPGPKTNQPAQIKFSNKARGIKALVVCNSWDLDPLDLLYGLAQGVNLSINLSVYPPISI